MEKIDQKISSLLKDKNTKLTVDDFLILKLIGKGSYGKVFLVKLKNNFEDDPENIFAMKILKKKEMMIRDQVLHIKTEKKIMELSEHPFLIKLKFAFHNKQKLYLITQFCPGGELFFHLSRVGRFNEQSVKFYASQIVLALEYLHSKDIIHRDLKPENVIIDKDGYTKLTDFGLAKENVNQNFKATSFCGTPEYLAPEILEKQPYGQEVDWWSLGVILYEMLVGRPPFYSKNREKLFQKILTPETLKYPKDISKDSKELMKAILVKENRISCADIKGHPFFKDVKWDSIENKKIKPPFIPSIKYNNDTKYFDEEFLCEPAVDSYNQGDTIESKDDLFKDFSYNNYKKSFESKELIVDH